MLFEWPYQNEFAAAYVPEMPSWLWVANMYLMIILGIFVGQAEAKANRFAKGAYRFVFLVVWYYASSISDG